MEHFQLIIDGAKVPTKEHFEVRNPSTGAVIGLAPVAARPISIVRFRPLAPHSPHGRSAGGRAARVCHAAGKKIGEHAEELRPASEQEQGKPLNGMGSRFELGGVQAWTHSHRRHSDAGQSTARQQ